MCISNCLTYLYENINQAGGGEIFLRHRVFPASGQKSISLRSRPSTFFIVKKVVLPDLFQVRKEEQFQGDLFA